MEVVVDASVAAKWLLPEVHSDEAARLLRADCELWAPDLIWAELGNILWKKRRLGELKAEEGTALLADFRRLPLHVHPSDLLLEGAWRLACSLDRSLDDSLYLALAMARRCRLVTADRRLWNALEGGAASGFLGWVADL